MAALADASLFDSLHEDVQRQVLGHLDSRSLSHASRASRMLRDLCRELVLQIKVPPMATKQQLQALQPARFGQAPCLSLIGPYRYLKPADVDELIRSAALHPQLMELRLVEVVLSGPLPTSTLSALPTCWPSLRHVTLHDTRLSCPLDCTDPVLLDALLRSLYAVQSKPLPHITILRQQVSEHEERLDANLLVTSKVFEALASLPQLTSLTLSSAYLHPHNLAVAALGRATKLTSLTLRLPSSWPYVTVHGLHKLPASLALLTLQTQRPLRAWRALSALAHHHACPSAALTAGGCDHPRCPFAPAPKLHQQQHAPLHAQPPTMGLQGPAPGLRVVLEGAFPEEMLEVLPSSGTLGCLPSLTALRLASSCKEQPAPDPAEEGVDAGGPPPDPREQHEAALLAAALAAAPQLAELQLSNAGPLLTGLVAARMHQAPLRELHVSCHSRVDACTLLAAQPRARLHLSLKGVSVAQLQSLVRAVQPAQADGPVQADAGGITQPANLVRLHLLRCHELTDQHLADALAAMPSVTQLTCATCRTITCELVLLAARLRRPIRLRVTSCRLVSAKGWAAAIRDARQVEGCHLVDVKYPDENDLSCEVAFEQGAPTCEQARAHVQRGRRQLGICLVGFS